MQETRSSILVYTKHRSQLSELQLMKMLMQSGLAYFQALICISSQLLSSYWQKKKRLK
ncbi:UNVERIFIED_CONTAM: hypothetical protein GTU68_027785 [Idotea baltica]|nr:hypothetical protein [Idotea baltica]